MELYREVGFLALSRAQRGAGNLKLSCKFGQYRLAVYPCTQSKSCESIFSILLGIQILKFLKLSQLLGKQQQIFNFALVKKVSSVKSLPDKKFWEKETLHDSVNSTT